MLTPLTTAEVAARDRASQEYDAGLNLFFARRYAEAEALLDRATRNDAADARYWYYLGLARALQGKPAEEAFRIAVASGTAATLELGAGRFDPREAGRLVATVRVDELEAVGSEA